MSEEVYGVTGRVFYGTITKAYDSAFTDGTELLGADRREHILRIKTSGMALRDMDSEATPKPGIRFGVSYELEIDVRSLDAATIALMLNEIDRSSGAGVQAVAGTPRSAVMPTTALIVRPMKHSASARYLFGTAWAKDQRRTTAQIVYGTEGPHLRGSKLVLRATRPITQTTASVDHPAAAWDTSAALLTAYESILSGT